MRTGDHVRVGRAFVGAVVTAVPLLHALSCTSDAPVATPSNDAAAEATDAGADMPARDSDYDPPRPAGIPDGWERFDGYSKFCQHYLPTSLQALPPPVRWEPCSVDAGAGVSCRQMAEEPGQKNTVWSHVSRLSTGEVVMTVDRQDGDFYYRLIAEADGPTRFALLEANYDRCQIDRPRLWRDRFVMGIIERSELGGMIIGDVGSIRPRVATRYADNVAHDMYATSFGVVSLSDGHSFRSYRWADGAFDAELVAADGYQNGDPRPFEEGFTWTSSDGFDTKVRMYIPSAGARDLIKSGQLAVGDGDLGTDGKDFVWVRASGRTNVGPTFASLEIFTAPFTTDPASLVPRRLRSEEGIAFGIREFTVGCGYAARSTGTHVRIVKIGTGESWKLPSVAGWSEPLFITCDEIFMRAYFGFGSVARVRLDSLGPAIPPD